MYKAETYCIHTSQNAWIDIKDEYYFCFVKRFNAFHEVLYLVK